MITVTINGEKKQYPQGTTYETIAEDYQDRYQGLIALVAVDGKIRELFKRLSRDCEISFFTLRDDVGHKTYVRAATMLFLKAVQDVFGNEAAQNCRVEFTIGHGYYVRPKDASFSSGENAEKILKKMKKMKKSLKENPNRKKMKKD